jgi:hypothetical protein
MNIIDALKAIESELRPGITVECWMLSNGKMMRCVEVNEYRVFAKNNDEWAAAIEAWKVLADMPQTCEEFTDKYPETLRRNDDGDAKQDSDSDVRCDNVSGPTF